MPDAQVIANAIRQAELEKRHRDLTKPVPAIGTDGESLRAQRGFEGITDEILAERANFNLRASMQQVPNVQVMSQTSSKQNHIGDIGGSIDLASMDEEQLASLADATLTEMARRQKKEAE